MTIGRPPSCVGLTDFYTQLIYGAVILDSVSIDALLRRRFEH